MSHPLTKKTDDFAPIEPQAAGALVSDARAGEIRGELCAKYGSTWLHYYGRAIEAEVLRVQALATPHPHRAEILEEAKAQYGSDDIEIADPSSAKLSESVDGCWVQAWVWVAGAKFGVQTQ